MFGRIARAGLGAATIALALLLGAGAASAQQPFRLIVTETETPLVPNSVMELALQLGYFAQEGVNVQLVRVQQTPSAITALIAGEGEMANIAVDAVLQAIARGVLNARTVTSPNKSLPFLIAAQNAVMTPADLAGRSFGIGSIGSLDYSLSRAVLANAGVDIDRVSLVSLGQPAIRAQALAAGRVSATTMSIGTWLAMPDRTGLHVLIDTDAYYLGAPVVNKVNLVPVSVLNNRRDDVIAVVRAIMRASRDFAANPTAWVDAMAVARPDVPRADLETLAAAFAASWSVNGGLSATELQFTADWQYATEAFADTPVIGLDRWVDFSIVDGILAELGVAEGADEPVR